MPIQAEIYEKVCATLVDALNVEREEINSTSTLQGDLGAESINFLDIVFRLEREFGIKIPRNELFPESIFQGDPEYVQDGKITDAGMAHLARILPAANLDLITQRRDLYMVGDLFTVEYVAKYIEGRLAARGW